MLKVQRGELEAMGVLFERHHRNAFRFFFRTVGEAATSDDLVQNLFVRMLKYRQTFRAEARFTTWMYQIAVNVRNDHFAKVGRRPAEGLENELQVAVQEPESDAREEQLRVLERGYSRLSDADRLVLSLCKYQGLSGREVAEILGISVGAVKVRVHRALRRLRTICAEAGGDVEGG